MLSQNKKIAIWTVAIFALSFASMVMFLDFSGHEGHQASVIDSHAGHSSDTHTTSPDPDNENIVPQFVVDLMEFRSSEYPTVLTDRELNVVHLRDDFCQLVGKEKRLEYKNKNLFTFVNAEEVPELAALNVKLLNEGHEVQAMGPFRLQAKDEAEKLVMLSAKPVKDPDGEVEYIIFKFRDLSDKVEQIISGEEDESEETTEKEVENLEESFDKAGFSDYLSQLLK